MTTIDTALLITIFTCELFVVVLLFYLWRCALGIHIWKYTYGLRGTTTRTCQWCGKIQSKEVHP